MDLQISDSNESIETWLLKDFVTDDLRTDLKDVAILIVPVENLRENVHLAFPIGTEGILGYFKEQLQSNIKIDICITDEDYQEYAFYSNYKRLGDFVIKKVAIPVFVTVLSSFVIQKIIAEDNSQPQIEIKDESVNVTINNHISTLAEKKYLEPTQIKFSVTVVDSSGTSKKFSYEGPATNIDTVLKSLKDYEN
ncbi:hypothetical protein [Acidiluteibacter ferrifornacis]|uniref:Uncharacterized protein n=1 Tax=Acidiluteibacter ferrifornacis TaxID=2692424 RepID=A0A6N9NKD3_9FLAO|nr:hypothetical protein [Acidiluteibacter ferrifornacis]NBG67156.1 hypothetical protein [Acidiluteibacter ferrifornacis]